MKRPAFKPPKSQRAETIVQNCTFTNHPRSSADIESLARAIEANAQAVEANAQAVLALAGKLLTMPSMLSVGGKDENK